MKRPQDPIEALVEILRRAGIARRRARRLARELKDHAEDLRAAGEDDARLGSARVIAHEYLRRTRRRALCRRWPVLSALLGPVFVGALVVAVCLLGYALALFGAASIGGAHALRAHAFEGLECVRVISVAAAALLVFRLGWIARCPLTWFLVAGTACAVLFSSFRAAFLPGGGAALSIALCPQLCGAALVAAVLLKTRPTPRDEV